ncbi:MAG: Peroxisomal membrane protein PMP27, partial [Tremellales sp. Tagirdzhanova-0007]
MSALATDLILHPALSQSLAVLATTLGRDKVYRLVQYLARLIAWSFLRRGSIEAADRWDGLKNGLTMGRRAMRVFRPVEFLQAAMKLAQRPITNLSGPGQLAQFTQIGRQLGYAGFLGTDMLFWLGTIRFLKYDKAKLKRIQDISMKFWFSGIVLSLVSSSASLVKLRADGRRFALSNEIARRETGSEKSSEDRIRDDEERRGKGRALLA